MQNHMMPYALQLYLPKHQQPSRPPTRACHVRLISCSAQAAIYATIMFINAAVMLRKRRCQHLCQTLHSNASNGAHFVRFAAMYFRGRLVGWPPPETATVGGQ